VQFLHVNRLKSCDKYTHNSCNISQLLGAFAKFQKASISFNMSVCPSVRPYAWNSFPTGWIFIKFGILIFLKKYVEKIQDSLKSDKNDGYFT